jgi:hypothetical protein
MLGLQAIDRDDDIEVVQPYEGWIQLPEGAGYKLNVYAAVENFRNDDVKLPITDKRVSTDKRHVERLEFVDYVKDAADESVALSVAELTEGDVSA